MESSHDKIVFEDDLIHDDNTSCTSSLATSLSEDPDDLYLGAEANSFDFGFLRKDDHHITERRGSGVINKLIVCHDRHTSFDSNTTSHTYSSINSVSDLIDARECNASEILLNLGFAVHDEQQIKRDILSRFNFPSFAGTEDTLVDTNNRNEGENTSVPTQTSSDITESIHKTQEWLAYRTGQQTTEDNQTVDTNKNNQAGSDSLSSGKRSLPRVFKLRKFSKSRQPSFELLLPKVKEEDAPAETDLFPNMTSQRRLCGVSSPVARKTSKTATSASDAVFSPINKERVQSSVSDVPRDFQEEVRHFDKDPTVASNPPPPHITKTSLLTTGKGESLDLEEIASNEDASDDAKLRHNASPQQTRLRRVGVFRQPSVMAPPGGDCDGTRHEGACESDENESSSGFDEDDVNDGVLEQGESPLKISPTKVVESIQKPCCCSTTLTHHNPPTRQSKYVYDVSSHVQGDDVCAASSQLNQNNNCNLPVRCVASVRCSSASPRNERCIISTQSRTRPTHRSTDARKKRREFAARSALSGDTFIELSRSLPPSSLLYRDGSYFFRKRRSGNFGFCNNLQHQKAPLRPLNGYDDVNHTRDVSQTQNCARNSDVTSGQESRDVRNGDDVTNGEKQMKKSLSFNGFGHVFSPA